MTYWQGVLSGTTFDGLIRRLLIIRLSADQGGEKNK